MAVKPVNTVSNPEQRDYLFAKAIPVKDSADVLQLINDLVDTADSCRPNCLGLAANQIWDGDVDAIPSVCVIYWAGVQPDNSDRWKVFINPTGNSSGPHIKDIEGCLSFPGKLPKMVKREKSFTVNYMGLDNIPDTLKVTKELARALQHEIDHLRGRVIYGKDEYR